MITTKLYLRKYADDSSGIVWISFYVNREKVNFSTKVSVSAKNWNEKKMMVGSGDKLAADKNLILENIQARINNVLVKYRLKDRKLTRDMFLRAYHRPTDFDTFFEFVKMYQRKYTARIELSTLNTHNSVMNKLKEYNERLTFDDITREWLDDYFIYLRKQLDNNDNTAYKNMAILKKYVRAAFKAGYMDNNPFNEWSIKRGSASCTYLTEEELGRLTLLYQSGELDYNYHKTLEFFLFMCFSSLHVGDALRLKLEQFSKDTFTYFRMKLRNSKPEPIQIPISLPLRKLLNNIAGTRRKGPLFEVTQTEQAMNRNLKVIAEMAKIDKSLTHKVARHTFATIFLKNTKDLASLKEILGHSDIKETLVYAHVMNESKEEGMRCFNAFQI